ncbi:hypothetical protein VDS34_06050 [Xanthomonas campestris pv. campestris]|nr:hypothetical protein [Xanthomonas campestris pv. campestris]
MTMANAVRTYSSFFSCLYDLPEMPGRYGAYSVFRAIDSRDVEQQLTPLPRVHDFAVIWDDDQDIRIIPVIEEMLMAGLLPGVQFIGEHKGTLTIILAARTYWKIDVVAYRKRIEALTRASNDFWNVRVGMYDHSEGNLHVGNQCDFQNITGLNGEEQHAFLFTIDGIWGLGTKEWGSIDMPEPPLPPPLPGKFFTDSNRYRMRRPKNYLD